MRVDRSDSKKDKDTQVTDTDKDKVVPKPNVFYIFEKQGVLGYQIWHFLQKFPQHFSTKTNFPPVYYILHSLKYLSFAQFTWSSLFSTFEVFTSMSSLLKQRNSFLKTKLDDAEHVLTLIKTDISL